MVEIKPFAALTYNHKTCKPKKVICPPYDVITSREAKFYRRLSSCNLIHLTLPVAAKGRSRYQAASRRFNNYLNRGVLCLNQQPAIYIYQQEFRAGPGNNLSGNKNRRFRRLGFIACLNLNSSSSIYGHEHTRIEPKEDRFKLLVKVKANLEPIFILFSDPDGFMRNTFNRYIKLEKPLMRFKDQNQNINTLWKISRADIIRQINRKMSGKTLFIADGHHRYEVSLNYRDWLRRSSSGRYTGKNKNCNYIMTYFCPIQSSGLIIKPVHRLVRDISRFPMEKLGKYFLIRKAKPKQFFSRMQSESSRQREIGMYYNHNFYIFTLKDKQILNKIDKDYRNLDVCLLNQLVLKRLLGIHPEDRQRVSFAADVNGLIRQANINKSSLVFFLKPVGINQIVYLAKTGKKMPAKTTYFYPKVPSGLVIYKFEN